MSKTKKLIEQSILLAIDSIREDIQSSTNVTDNKTRAESIRELAEAYKAVNNGKV